MTQVLAQEQAGQRAQVATSKPASPQASPEPPAKPSLPASLPPQTSSNGQTLQQQQQPFASQTPGYASASRPTPPPLQIVTPPTLPRRREQQQPAAAAPQPATTPGDDAARGRVPPIAIPNPSPHSHPQSQNHSHAAPQAGPSVAAAAANGSGNGNWRQGKPIFDWITRKLGGGRRGSNDAGGERPPPPEPPQQRTSQQQQQQQQHNGGGDGSGGKGNGGRSQPYKSITYTRAPSRSKKMGYERAEQRERRAQLSPVEITSPSRNSVDSPYRTDTMSLRSYAVSYTASERRREANNPYPSLPIPLVRRSYAASTIDSGSRAPSMSVLTRSRTPSLASLSSIAARRPRISVADDGSGSIASDSMRLAGRVADEDASVRPIPPSPTSVSFISRSGSVPVHRVDSHVDPDRERERERHLSATPPPMTERRDTMSSGYGASYLSEGSRQDSLASTKPTTLMSFDSGMTPAHIAVASPSQAATPPGITRRSSSPSALNGTAPPSLLSQGGAASPVSPSFPTTNERVPVHSRYHPRNNPNPSAAPRPDASIITLASSTYAAGPSPVDRAAERPWERITHAGSLRIRDGVSPSAYHPPPSSASPTVAFADQHDGLSTTMSLSVRTRDKYARADEDASVRALRRRGSWESGESRWSWRPAVVGDGGSVFLNRRSEVFTDEQGEQAPLRGSIYRERDYRSVLSTWAAEHEEGSDTALSHRPVSVSVGVV